MQNDVYLSILWLIRRFFQITNPTQYTCLVAINIEITEN